jgi:hypothetical protein
MSATHPLAVVNTASITSLVRMTLYHHSISVYHTAVETNEDMVVLGGRARSAAPENAFRGLVSDIPGGRRKSEAGGTAPHGTAARCDNHEQPCVIDGPCSDSERKIP